MTVGLHIGASTNVGAQRSMNQDSFVIAERLAVVADGMGGHRGGEVASSIAARAMIAAFDRPALDALVEGVTDANRRILDHAATNPTLTGMGTTVVALALIDTDEGLMLGAVNVGDSRMYRMTGSELQQLTEDHSLVEALVREGRLTAQEAEVHPQRNIVTRALGVVDDVDVDHFNFIPKLGDRYLLCSDGLSDEVRPSEILTILATYADPQETADALIVAANASGGRDNITTVVVDIVDEREAALPATTSAFASPEVPEVSTEARPADADPSPDVTVPGIDLAEQPGADAANTADESLDVPGEARQRWSWRR